MSLPGLPPLPKSLSGFDLAGQQLQSHQQHHHQNHHHHQQHHPPQHQPPAPPQQQQQQHLQPPQQQHLQQQQQQQQQQQHPQGLPPSLNHHPTNPFIPIGVNLHSVSMASLVSQRGQSPVSSSTANSMVATPNSSGSGSGTSGGQASAVRKPTTLDTQLAILRREMYGLRQLDLSLLSQLWALNESIQEFRTMLQEQETLSPPSPTPSNSDANSVSSDDDEDDSSNTQTVGGGGVLGGIGSAGSLLTNHNLIESVAAASVLSSSQTASSRMRAPPPPPPNRKAPSRPV